MMQLNTYHIQVKDSIVDPDRLSFSPKRDAYYKDSTKTKNRTFYKVWLYLSGNDLPFIVKAKYILHNSFKNPIHVVERSTINKNCKLGIWTWGIFNVRVELEDIRGRVFVINHRLDYGSEINNGNINLVKVKK